MAALCGIGIKEAMLQNPGMMQDIFELYARVNRTKDGENSGSTDDID